MTDYDITHPNGAPKFAADGTMLDEAGNRSVFDDVDDGDDGPAHSEYRVEWRLDVDGRNPPNAAWKAFEIMRAPKRQGVGDAVVFHVIDGEGFEHAVDLDDVRWPAPEPTDPVSVPRAALQIIARAAQDSAYEIEEALTNHDYDPDTVPEKEADLGEIERALKYVPEELRPGSGDVAKPSFFEVAKSIVEPLHVGELPGDDGLTLRDENGLTVGRLEQGTLVLTETEWKVVAGLCAVAADTKHEAAPRIIGEMIGQPADVVLAFMRKVFGPAVGDPKWKVEFPDFDDEPPAAWLAEHSFEDVSWHNDVCPSWLCDVFTLYVDYADPEKRDHPEAARFSLHDEERTVLTTDEWLDVRAFVEDGKRVFEKPPAGQVAQLAAARKHLRAMLRNQVGVEEDAIESEARMIEDRCWRDGARHYLQMADRLYGEAYRYEDM
jgi:hypothetical protein